MKMSERRDEWTTTTVMSLREEESGESEERKMERQVFHHDLLLGLHNILNVTVVSTVGVRVVERTTGIDY